MPAEAKELSESLRDDVAKMKAFQAMGDLNTANHYYCNITREASKLGLSMKQVMDLAQDTPQPAGA